MSAFGYLLGILIFAMIVGVYAVPSVVAGIRHVPDFGSVLVINVLLGWTFIGWVVALAMAMRSTQRPPVQIVTHQAVYGPPPADPRNLSGGELP
jgi:hypothetical protein